MRDFLTTVGFAAAALVGLCAGITGVVIATGYSRAGEVMALLTAGIAVTAIVAVVAVGRRSVTRAGVARDAADRAGVGARALVAEEKQSQSAIVDALDLGVLVIDGRDRVLHHNVAAANLLGRIPGDLRAIVPAAIGQTVNAARASGDRASQDVEVGRPATMLMVTAAPLGDDRLLVSVVDVTETRRIAAARTHFVADASHELKTPIAAIKAAAETVIAAIDRDKDAAKRFAAEIDVLAARLDRIVTDLLDLSRFESEPLVPDRVAFSDVVREETQRLAAAASARSITLDVHAAPTVVLSTRKDLAIVVRNLVENAIQYTPGGGKVSVHLGRSGSDAVFEVIDTGFGIPSRDVPRVFERFYRVDVARSRDTGGTGLGLALVKHVAERHVGGSVSVASTFGEGSTFRFAIPAVD